MPDVSCKNTQTAYKGDANLGLIFHFLTPRQHLKKVHGITGAAVEVSSLTVPASMAYADRIMEPLRVSYALYPFPPRTKTLDEGVPRCRRNSLSHERSDSRAILLPGVRLWKGLLVKGAP